MSFNNSTKKCSSGSVRKIYRLRFEDTTLDALILLRSYFNKTNIFFAILSCLLTKDLKPIIDTIYFKKLIKIYKNQFTKKINFRAVFNQKLLKKAFQTVILKNSDFESP